MTKHSKREQFLHTQTSLFHTYSVCSKAICIWISSRIWVGIISMIPTRPSVEFNPDSRILIIITIWKSRYLRSQNFHPSRFIQCHNSIFRSSWYQVQKFIAFFKHRWAWSEQGRKSTNQQSTTSQQYISKTQFLDQARRHLLIFNIEPETFGK